MPTASEHQTAKAREQELIDALDQATREYEDARIQDTSWGEGPGHRAVIAESDSAALLDFGETMGEALWRLYRDCDDDSYSYDPADAFHDFLPGPAIIAAAARLTLHRKRHERSAVKARLNDEMEAV